jgi:hypothetical protein
MALDLNIRLLDCEEGCESLEHLPRNIQEVYNRT